MGEARWSTPLVRWLRATVVLSALAVPQASWAQPKTNVDATFTRAREMMREGDFRQACPLLEGLLADGGTGVRFNLAYCYENDGKLASAYHLYLEVVEEMRGAGEADKLTVAQERADQLLPRLSRLKLSIVKPVVGLTVELDGKVVDAAALSGAIPVDSGSVAVSASAPDHQAWNSTVDVSSEGATTTVTVPALRAMADVPDEGDAPSSQRIAAYALGGVGVVAVAAGIGMAVTAQDRHDEALPRCVADPAGGDPFCSVDDVNQIEDAAALGTAGTALWVIGGAMVIGGGALFVLTLDLEAHEEQGARTLPDVRVSTTGVQLSWQL